MTRHKGRNGKKNTIKEKHDREISLQSKKRVFYINNWLNTKSNVQEPEVTRTERRSFKTPNNSESTIFSLVDDSIDTNNFIDYAHNVRYSDIYLESCNKVGRFPLFDEEEVDVIRCHIADPSYDVLRPLMTDALGEKIVDIYYQPFDEKEEESFVSSFNEKDKSLKQCQAQGKKINDCVDAAMTAASEEEYIECRNQLIRCYTSLLGHHGGTFILLALSYMTARNARILQYYMMYYKYNREWYMGLGYPHVKHSTDGLFGKRLFDMIEIRARVNSLEDFDKCQDTTQFKDDEYPLIPIFDQESGENMISNADIYRASGSYTIPMVNKMEHFKAVFDGFTYGALQQLTYKEEDGCSVMVTGSSVMTCLRQHPHLEPLHENYKAIQQAIAPLPLPAKRIIQQHLIEEPNHSNWYNQIHYIFGSANDCISTYKSADIDVFLLSNSEEAARKRLVKVVREIATSIRTEYHIVRTPKSVTILPLFPYRPIQIVTSLTRDIRDHLLKVDLDCTNFAFDGNNVYTMSRGIRSFVDGSNHLSPHQWYTTPDRIQKYVDRGFNRVEFDICEHLPQCQGRTCSQIPNRMRYTMEGYFSLNDRTGEVGLNELPSMWKSASKVLLALERWNYPQLINPDVVFAGTRSLERFIKDHIEFWKRKGGGLRNHLHCYQCEKDIPRQLVPFNQIPVCQDCRQTNKDKWSQWDTIKIKSIGDGQSPKYALVTGGRMKIGFFIALRLLRSGYKVLITTRFPWIAVKTYRDLPDYTRWKDNLMIYGIDLRHLPSVQKLILYVKRWCQGTLDILINNAAQTIRRPRAYYSSLLDQEEDILLHEPSPEEVGHIVQSTTYSEKVLMVGDGDPDTDEEVNYIHDDDEAVLFRVNKRQNRRKSKNAILETNSRITALECSLMTQLELTEDDKQERNDLLFPPNQFDQHGEPLDKRDQTTWRNTIQDTSLVEMLEVQLVNVTVPFLLIQQLSPLMFNQQNNNNNNEYKFIINVSAQEGSFSKGMNRGHHIHNNMAKASLNMMTMSIAHSYLAKGVYVCGVDTGWCTKMTRHENGGPKSPLDAIDGAVRVLDPIYSVLTSSTNQLKLEAMNVGGMFRHYRKENNNSYSGKHTPPSSPP